MMLEDENHRRHLALLAAISQVSSDLPPAAALLADAADDAAAISRLSEAYGLTAEQSEGVVEQQLWLLNGARRAELQYQLRKLARGARSDLGSAAHRGSNHRVPSSSRRRRAAVVIEGDEHRVEGQKLGDTVERIVDVVREQVALPHRRRVSVDVDTGVAKALTRILIDPVSSARYFCQDDDAH